MIQFINGRIGFFDAGTSDPDSLSLWFPSNVPGTPIFEETLFVGERAKEAASSNVDTPLRTFLPKHRTWSGGLLFTLPEAPL